VIVIAIVVAGFVLPAAYLHLCLFLAKDEARTIARLHSKIYLNPVHFVFMTFCSVLLLPPVSAHVHLHFHMTAKDEMVEYGCGKS